MRYALVSNNQFPLSRGVDLNAVDMQSQTALDYASDNEELSNFIEDAGGMKGDLFTGMLKSLQVAGEVLFCVHGPPKKVHASV